MCGEGNGGVERRSKREVGDLGMGGVCTKEKGIRVGENGSAPVRDTGNKEKVGRILLLVGEFRFVDYPRLPEYEVFLIKFASQHLSGN